MARIFLHKPFRLWLVLTLLHTALAMPIASRADAPYDSGTSGDALDHPVTLSYLRRTLNALQGSLEFFRKQYDQVNLDAVIGTRIVEGSLKVLLGNLQRNQQTTVLPDDVIAQIRHAYYVAKRVSDDSEPHVSENQPVYYKRIGPAIQEGVWELNYTRRTLMSDGMAGPVWNYTAEEAMTEDQSDDCLTELFGTTGKRKEKCVISDTCWSRMTQLGYSRYSLSHEIFYLQLGEQSGCLAQMGWRIVLAGQGSLRQLQDTFCTNMLREAHSIVEADYPAPQQDLFMEQGALCGLYGFWEFFHYRWLDKILSWQDPETGCYKWAGWPRDRIGEDDTDQHHISKREERRLKDGCLCHRTTVAAGALSLYVRYLVAEYIAEARPDLLELE